MTNHNANLKLINSLIRERISVSNRPLLIAHMRPDGDAIGSLIGLGLALQSAGKQPRLVLTDGLPSKFKFLEGSQDIQKQIETGYDLVITLDASDKRRLGNINPELAVDINIDHHITNEHFGEINLVLPEQPATSSILATMMPEWGLAISKPIASALLAGIITDTIGFRTSNVTPQLLRLCADLMDCGADLPFLYNKVLIDQTFADSQLWGLALSRLKHEGRILWTSITLDDRKQAGHQGKDDADLTNLLSGIQDHDIAVLFNEQNDGKVKVSWRSNELVNVADIAVQFGGGGHPAAAGAEVAGSLSEVEEKILRSTKNHIKGN